MQTGMLSRRVVPSKIVQCCGTFVTLVTLPGDAFSQNVGMKSLRTATLLLVAIILPGGFILLVPMVCRAIRRVRALQPAND